MVPANDEHTSTNEPEDNTSTRGTFFEKLKFWKRDKKDANEPARLKTLPKSLMHWTTPVWIAAAGFLIALAFAAFWRGELHWPSADAMKLCATIAGAGFAFSAWQQRSHDNVVNAKQAQKTVERDDYWKRREQIYQLLGSKNPGLRLSAVALLAELADSAAHSTLLNDTEKQQLQRHIIDTLCLQVRHEGLTLSSEGTEGEHESIQKQIFDTILKRINDRQSVRQYADWTREPIMITDCRILPPIAITNLSTNATLDFSNSDFQQSVTIQNSIIDSLTWNSAKLHNNITIGGEHEKCKIGTNTIPQCKGEISVSYTTFRSDPNGFTIYTPSASCGKYSFRHCTFISTRCRCNMDCHCRTQDTAENCRCMTQDLIKCSCTGLCINNSVAVHTAEDTGNAPIRTRYLAITNCQISTLDIVLSNNLTEIHIEENIITTQLYITFFWLFKEITAHNDQNPEEPVLYIQWNIFSTPSHSQPIEIYDNDGLSHPHAILFSGNKVINPADHDDKRPLSFSFHEEDPQPYTFSEKIYPTTLEPLVGSWQTGGYVEDEYDDTEE